MAKKESEFRTEWRRSLASEEKPEPSVLPASEEDFLKSVPRPREAPVERTGDLDPRSGFLFSRIDGRKNAAEIMVVAGMSRRETIQRMAELFQRGLIDFGEGTPRAGAFLQNFGRSLSETEKEEIRLTWMRLKQGDFYARLGLKPGAREAEIRQAYWELSKKFHPDRYSGIELADYRQYLQEINSRINEAYQALRNPSTRTGSGEKKAGPPAESGPETAAEECFQEAHKLFAAGNFAGALNQIKLALGLSPRNPKYREFFLRVETLARMSREQR